MPLNALTAPPNMMHAMQKSHISKKVRKGLLRSFNLLEFYKIIYKKSTRILRKKYKKTTKKEIQFIFNIWWYNGMRAPSDEGLHNQVLLSNPHFVPKFNLINL